jgi:hypothetical protein
MFLGEEIVHLLKQSNYTYTRYGRSCIRFGERKQ